MKQGVSGRGVLTGATLLGSFHLELRQMHQAGVWPLFCFLFMNQLLSHCATHKVKAPGVLAMTWDGLLKDLPCSRPQDWICVVMVETSRTQ